MLVLAVLFALDPFPVRALRNVLFDGYQRALPRLPRSHPAVVVAIDEAALAARGQWPWPRALTGQLLQRIEELGPAAIGVDVLFADFAADGSGDAALARAMTDGKVVLGVAGIPERQATGPARPNAPPFLWTVPPPHALQDFRGHLQSLPIIDEAAAGHGLLNSDSGGRVIRRVPLVARVSDTYVPALGVELLRVAHGVPELRVASREDGLLALRFANFSIPMQRDGSIWLHFSPHEAGRHISAEAVLEGRVDRERLQGKVVLVGLTGLGLLDQKPTPRGESVPGVELHQQLLEQIVDGSYLVRPVHARSVEAALLLVAGALMIIFVPILRAWASAVLFVSVVIALAAIGLGFFHLGSLIDIASPAVGATLVYGTVLAATLSEADRQRRALRDAAERMEGELQAARRIQMGLLPMPVELFGRDERFAISALLEPARTVGGDFYDCFMLDADRLFFVVADVSGKGLPASLFMALSKTLLKSAALRPPTDIGSILGRASAEIGRENPEALFVSLFAGIFDARTGKLEYCNAGHQPPYSKRPNDRVQRFELADGPPLCVLADHSYRTRYRSFAPNEWLCVLTDGVTEAMSSPGEMFGTKRLEAVLDTMTPDSTPEQIVTEVRDAVARFVDGADPSDDLTLLCLKWHGHPLSGR